MFSNIASQKEKDEDTRRRKLLAARSKLPMALSAAHKVFSGGIYYSASYADFEHNQSLERLEAQSIPRMTLPDQVITTFIEVIEHHDDGDVANRLSGLLREYQVFMARWVGEFERKNVNMITSPEQERERTVSWAYLVSINGSLFEYAREGSDLEEVTEKSIASVLRLNLPAGEHAEDYKEEIGLYARTFLRRFA